MKKLTEKLEELFGIDLRALAFVRIGFSFLIFVDLIQGISYFNMFYSEQGMLPSHYAKQLIGHSTLCLNLINTSDWFQWGLYFLLMGFTMGLMFGYKTRICTFMVWVLLASFFNRNLLIVGAEDKILVVLFFWVQFIPWGERYSIDSVHKKIRITANHVSSMATVAFLLQICFIYFFTGYLKAHPQWTTDRTAMMIVLSGDQFIKPWAKYFLQYPDFLKFLTASVLNLERWGPILLFFPFKIKYVRLIITLLFMSFHAGILLTMELNLFQWFSLCSLLVFLPKFFWDKLLGDSGFSQRSNDLKTVSAATINLFRLPSYLSLLLAFLIIYALAWNIEELNPTQRIIPTQIRWIGEFFTINQRWRMYAPRPYDDDGWFVVPGRLKNGKLVDVFNSGKDIDWQEPDSIPDHNGNYRITLFSCRIHRPQYLLYLNPWADFMCRKWNKKHSKEEQLNSLDIIFMQRDLKEDGSKPIPKPIHLFTKNCHS